MKQRLTGIDLYTQYSLTLLNDFRSSGQIQIVATNKPANSK